MKKYGVDWRFCPECQCIQQRIYEDKPSHTGKISWVSCNHDFRPNSPKGVLENQAKEIESLGLQPYVVRTYQSPYEFQSFLYLSCMYLEQYPVIVEIGSFHGGTAARMNDFLNPRKLICIDRCFDYWLAGDWPRLTQIKGDSSAPETVEAFRVALGDDEIDLLFIDGDHSYAGEMADYKTYSPFVRDGGMIAFHDTHAIPDVGRIFQEVPGKAKFDLFSYQGIGVAIK